MPRSSSLPFFFTNQHPRVEEPDLRHRISNFTDSRTAHNKNIGIMNTGPNTLILALFLLGTTQGTAQTTIADGNWSDPSTWGGVPPFGTGNVVIGHHVVLDLDYGHSSGSLTVNPGGSLVGNSDMRAFALNYPGGTATMTVNGTFDVARVYLASNTVSNGGAFHADSLLCSATLTNSLGAGMVADQFRIDPGGTLNNAGSVETVNFLNISTVVNSGSVSASDFANSKDFTVANTGVMNIAFDFSNIDTLGGPAIFTINGTVLVGNDWHNGGQMNGSGRFCINHNTWNSGALTGTFDFCDLTGGDVDLNTGTVAGSITYCTTPCDVGTGEGAEEVLVDIFPDPFSSSATVRTGRYLHNAAISVVDGLGRTVLRMSNITGRTATLHRDGLPSGPYLLRLTQEGQVLATERIIIHD